MTIEQENDIVTHLAKGMTVSEIAAAIGTTSRTVNFHLQIIYSKYDIPPGKNRNIKLLGRLGHISTSM